MEFKEKQSIYLQIAEYVCDQILLKYWPIGEKIISIRELAASLEVNPNTVQRTYDLLQQLGVIANKRGVGYFVEPDAIDKIIVFRKEQFLKNDLPQFMRSLYLLQIDISDIQKHYQKFLKDIKSNKNEN